MTGIIVLAIIGYFIAKACSRRKSARAEARREREIESLAQAHIRAQEAWKRQQEEAKAAVKAEMERVSALEKEQERQWKEQLRLQREQERQAKEQARQAEQLAKHEKRIADLEFRMSEAERTIEHYKPQLDDLLRKAEEMDNRIWWYTQKGLPCEGIKKELVKVKDKAFKIETIVNKAEHIKEQAQRELAA